MTIEDAVSSLVKHRGVKKVVIIDDTMKNRIREEESQIVSSFGMPVINEGMRLCFSFDYALCIYCDVTFEKPETSTLFMKDRSGRVVGQDVTEAMKDSIPDNENTIWLSDDFVMYSNTDMASEIDVVMTSFEYHGFSEEDGVARAAVFYPAPSTDCIIRSAYGGPYESEIATAVMGVKLL